MSMRYLRMKGPTLKNRVAHAYHDYGRLCSAHPVSCLSMSVVMMFMLSYPAAIRFRSWISSPIEVYWSNKVLEYPKEASATPYWILGPPTVFLQQVVIRGTVEPWNSLNMTSEQLVESKERDENTFVHVYYRPRKYFSDYFPLATSYLILMLYLYYSARKFEMVASRWGLAFAAACTVAATLLMTTGRVSFRIFVIYSKPKNVLKFKFRSVVYTPPSLDVSSRIAHGLSQEGYSLCKYFVMELTFLAIGYMTGVSEIQEFCTFASVGLVIDFYMQLFFYAPCLTFDLQRLCTEDKQRFTLRLFTTEIPQLRNYPPVRHSVAVLGCSDGSLEIACLDRNKLIAIYKQSKIGVIHVQPLRVTSIVLLRSLRAHLKPISQIVTNLSSIVSACHDHTIKVFDINSAELKYILHAHNAPVTNICIDHETNMLFSSCDEGIICWWNMASGELIKSIDTSNSGRVELASTSEYLLGYSSDGSFRLWSKENGQLISRIAQPTDGGLISRGLVVMGCGVAATSCGQTVTFWNLQHKAIFKQVDLGSSINRLRSLSDRSVLCQCSNMMYRVNVPLHFLNGHLSQLEAAGVPSQLWGSLYVKLMQQTFDAGDLFRIICEESENSHAWSVLATKDLHLMDENNVFLIDHAWTFRPHQARAQLENLPQLDFDNDTEFGSDDEVINDDEEKEKYNQEVAAVDGQYLLFIMHDSVASFSLPMEETDSLINKILKEMWKYVQTFTVKYKMVDIDEESMPLWYIMDEFGVRISHSNTPNIRVVPLFFIPHNIAYNVMFLTKPISEGEEIFRDYADNALAHQHPEWRHLLLLPWHDIDVTGGNSEREHLDDGFFLSGRIADSVPTEEEQSVTSFKGVGASKKLRIFTDNTQLVNNLKIIDYEIVEDWRKADVLWLLKHFHKYRLLFLRLCINVAYSYILLSPRFEHFQTSFNLNTELPQFVTYFQKKALRGEENTWIIKPWNLARGLDMHVSNDLGQIIRLIESGPKIACKYISHPVLFNRPDNGCMVKFDLRYIVFVNQLRPVRAFVYNKFWIRFAINDFSLSRLDDNETHFTVFNYSDKTKIFQMDCVDFISHMERTYSVIKWSMVQKKINIVLKDALEAVSKADPPRGIASNKQSRSMYGADIMLEWATKDEKDVHVSLLEYNFMPDCERACHLYPNFADTVFKTMFLEEIDNNEITKL
uniref:SSD domain-containing protein n=1 Tax=Heterorhabditis bacteriophora TaxID=37862 RepID=A0A1I7XDM7_HETBA